MSTLEIKQVVASQAKYVVITNQRLAADCVNFEGRSSHWSTDATSSILRSTCDCLGAALQLYAYVTTSIRRLQDA